ncbi:MAG: outer membrane lipoprotein-sorting protein [bacterium]|nr:outer membrane lipoprotein-sorting protein [bacterium]
MKKNSCFVFVVLILVKLAVPLQANVKVIDVLKRLDKLQNLGEDITARVDIVQRDVDQGTKVMECIYYGRDISDLFLIVMTKPESEKGNGYLKSGNNFWMYRRNTRTFQHISRDESIAGTDANAGDFEKSKYAEYYESVKDDSGREIVIETMLGKIPVYRIEILAKIPDIDYPRKIIWVRKDNHLPLKEQSFSLSGTLMYSHYFLKYSKVNNKYISIKQLVIDEFEKGNKTLWEIKDISVAELSNNKFTKAYLENLSK